MIKHLSWSFALRWSTRGLTFVRLAILARLLTPGQFGLFAIGTLVLAFLEIVTETWINVFLVQQRDSIDKYINTAWIISIVRGTLISLLIILSTPWIIEFFSSPGSKNILLYLSIVPFLRGFINPSVVNLQRNLKFNHEFYYRLLLFISESIFTITLALILRSEFSLVFGMIFAALIEVVVSLLIFNPKPRFIFSQNQAKDIWKKGKWITAAGIFNYFYQNGDNLVVGRLLGNTQLGIYDYAYKLSSTPITEIGDVFAKVSLPVYVKLRDNLIKLKSTFIKNSLFVIVFSFIFSLVLYLFSDVLVSALLGAQWKHAIPVIKVLSIYGFSKAIVGTTFPLFLSQEKQSYVTLITLISILGLAITIMPLVGQFGIIGAGISASIGTLISLPVAVFLLFKLFKMLK